MRTKHLLTKTLLLVAVMLMGAGSAWAQAPVNTILWEETWTGGSANETPSAYGFEGTTVYGGATLTYAQSSINTKLYEEKLAEGTSPELLLSKSNQTWTISNIPTGQATGMSLTFLSNKTTFEVTSSTTGIKVSGSQKSWTITATSNVEKFDLTIKNTGSANARIDNIVLKVTTAGTGGKANCDLALTGAPIELSFDLYNNSSAQVINYTTSSTGAVTVSENDYVTTSVDQTNKTITVTPKTSVTPSVQTLTVSQDADDDYAAGSATFTVTIDDSTPAPTYTVTFSVNGTATTEEFEEGAAITFPANPADIEGKTFVGWTKSAISGVTDEAPKLVNSETMGKEALTFYAVFADKTPGSQTTVTDVLTNDIIGVTGTSSYSSWSAKTFTSDAVYAGNSAKSDVGAIQMRSNNSNSGIISTTSGGTLKSVTVTWTNGNTSGRSLDVYGSSTAYEAATDLYDSNKQGTKLGGIVYGTSTSLTVTGDYAYIGLRSNNGALYLADISIEWTAGTPDTYSGYCTTVVAAAVAKPVITVAENPFLFSTTATITCATEGAAIKYSFDGETWYDYSEALTITETKTIYAKGVNGSDESSVAQVTATKNLAEPTVTIDATGITNTNIFEGEEAGSLSASVTYNGEPITGATVTWSGNNDEVATIDASTGTVTLVAAGSVTFTATFAGNDDYSEKSATYDMTVVYNDPNANDGSAEKPYTVAEAIAYINTLGSNQSANEVYVSGIISQVDSYNSTYNSITYWISDDGTTTSQMEVYSGKGLNSANFSAVTDLAVGDIVTVKGYVKMYKSTPEFIQNNWLVSHVGSPKLSVDPATADPFTYEEGGDVADEQLFEVTGTNLKGDITISVTENFDLAGNNGYGNSTLTIASGDMFGVRPQDNLAEGNYTGTLTIASEGATSITIDLTCTVTGYVAPAITAAETTINVTAADGEGTINMTYSKIDTNLVEVEFYESDGTTTATYDWIDAEIDSENNLYYTVGANTGEARTAYMKVYGISSEGGDAYYYSDLITITQAAYVPVVEYALFTGDLIEGDYVIYYNGYAMKNTVDNGRLTYAGVTPNNDVITTNDAAIVWHIAPNGEYWNIFSADANAYAAGTGAKNKAQMLADGADDKALWSVTGTEAYDFVNKANAAANVNSNLRNNGEYGFACYATTTGGALSLYRKVCEEESVTISAAGYATYCSTKALDFSSLTGLTAYKATVTGNTVSFDKVTKVPAGEGVLLKGSANKYNIPVIESADALVNNSFIGVTEETPNVAAGIYVLMDGNRGVGFYKTKNAFTVGANTAYLPALPNGNTRSFIAIDEATAIEGIAAEKASNGEIYNLQGQRVVKAQKGLYIMNGKKVVMK